MEKNSPTQPLTQKEPGAASLPQMGADQKMTGANQEISALAQQLCNRRSAGSFTLGCGVDMLRSAAKEAGFALFEADLKGVKGKQNLINALAGATEFPPELGANWDALADGLCDLSWHKAGGYVLLLRNVSDTLGLSANDREIALDLFADTVVYWRQHNKAFWIFFP